MSIALKNLTDLTEWGFDDIIDVRAPAEFAQDHIPGAINMPALTDAQRAEVGTIYVQDSPFKARKIGAAYVARNVADHIEQHLANKDGGWQPLVHCWRGGQRSGSFGSILAQIGWRVQVLEGGYQAYRRLVVRAMYDQPVPHRFILLDGETGTAKTEVIGLLREAGAQVLDLEGIANHRGSLFGARTSDQPSQKFFEGQIALSLAGLETNFPIFVEAESNRIGQLKIPPTLWRAMCSAPRVTLSASVEARAAYLVRTYADILEDMSELEMRIEALRPYQPRTKIDKWRENALNRDYFDLAQGLMVDHYDPRYAKAQKRHNHTELDRISMSELDQPALRTQVVPQLMALAGYK